MTPGTYRARCVGAVLTAPKDGRERVHLKFALSDDQTEVISWDGFFGDNPAGETTAGEKKSLSDRTFDALRACGWEGDNVSQLETCKKNEVEIVVVNDDYKGESRLKVRFVQPVGTAARFMPAPLPPERAAQFAEQMRSRAQGIKSNEVNFLPSDEPPF